MSNNKKTSKKVLILIREGKRGYIVEPAGGGDPYPCLNAEDIGEAILEIFADPDQPSAEYAAPEPEPAKRRARVEEDDEDDDYDEPRSSGGGRPNGWSEGDELLVGLAGNLLEKARKFSDWER